MVSLLGISVAVFVLHCAHDLTVFGDTCPSGLSCENKRCCIKSNNDQYCCDPASEENKQNNYIILSPGLGSGSQSGIGIGLLIAGIILSVIVSVILCLLCNGCLCPGRCGRRRDGRKSDLPIANVYLHQTPQVAHAHPAVINHGSSRNNDYDFSPNGSDISYASRTKLTKPGKKEPRSILKGFK